MATVGYGDLIAVTNNEKIFIIIGMIISCGMFSYSIGAIGTIVNKPNIMVQEFKTKILHITQFLVHKKVPSSMRNKIKSFLDYKCEHKEVYKMDEAEVLGMLNGHLWDQVIAYLNGNLLKKSVVFKKFDIE